MTVSVSWSDGKLRNSSKDSANAVDLWQGPAYFSSGRHLPQWRVSDIVRLGLRRPYSAASGPVLNVVRGGDSDRLSDSTASSLEWLFRTLPRRGPLTP